MYSSVFWLEFAQTRCHKCWNFKCFAYSLGSLWRERMQLQKKWWRNLLMTREWPRRRKMNGKCFVHLVKKQELWYDTLTWFVSSCTCIYILFVLMLSICWIFTFVSPVFSGRRMKWLIMKQQHSPFFTTMHFTWYSWLLHHFTSWKISIQFCILFRLNTLNSDSTWILGGFALVFT